ncbi:MAG: DUF512 domain-containing protein, partial [Clostridia bacterium]|nr:DUF512 domain-containing protein [Clostridia bacterium]
LWALLKDEAQNAIADLENIPDIPRKISLATGAAAYPLIKDIAEKCTKAYPLLSATVYPITNNFFGEKITVAGLVTATDIINQLKGRDLGEELLIPSSMLRNEGDMFLDSITVEELSQKLNIKITPVNNDGYELIDKIIGIKEEY